MELQKLREWIGRTETSADLLGSAPVAALAATLDREDPPPKTGDELPPLWHWLYFLPVHRQSELGLDGHARLGGFLPPVPLPSRMWAGSRVEFHHPLRIGDPVTRCSRIVDVRAKEGRSGPLVFVVVRHEVANGLGVALTEEHDIVYREASRGAAVSQAAPTDAEWERRIVPGDVLLFRYSALTFNGHRIHYDRRYATETEHYPGLVVHGPLIATLLLDLVRRNLPAAAVTKFSFRAVSALFDTEPFVVCGRREQNAARLWARAEDGRLAMDAHCELRP